MAALEQSRERQRSDLALLAIAVLVSLAFSALGVYQTDIVSSDGVFYLHAARAIAEFGAAAAFEVYPWPFYSWLIFLVHSTTGFDFEISAHLLNAFFYGALTFFFIALVRELGGSRAVLVAAAVVVLTHPKLVDYRAEVLRDSGYYAFYLAAILLFIRYCRDSEWRYAVGWAAAIIVATLFRIEGIVIFALLPLALLLHPDRAWSTRWKLLARAYVPHAVAVAVALAAYWVSGSEQTGRLLEPMQYFERAQDLGSHLDGKASALSYAILNRFSDDFAMSAVIAVLAVILLREVIRALTLPYGLFALHAVYSKLIRLDRGTFRVLAWVIALNLMVLAVFLSQNFYLTGRFPIPLTLIILLAVPFSLAALYEQWRSARAAKWGVFPVICAVLVFITADNFVSLGSSKTYLKEAGRWLRDNTPHSATLYANDTRLGYYAERKNVLLHRSWEETEAFMSGDAWRNYDYLAVEIGEKFPGREQWIQAKIGAPPVATHANNRNDRVVVFKVD